jgi:enoyl-CoA hydratase/carnithine racemase
MPVRVAIAPPVATIWLERPDQRNAFDREMLDGLVAALDRVRDDPDARVVLLRGAGPVFSSGIDHTLLADLFGQMPHVPWKHLHHDVQAPLRRLEVMTKPVVAVPHGLCIGLAFELALACDFRVASAECVFGLPEIAFGILPDVGGTTKLVRLAGGARAKELILTGCSWSAARAERFGVLHEVAPDPAAALAVAERLAAAIATHPPAAVGAAKSLIDRSAEVDDRTSLQLEGAFQWALVQQPGLVERFPQALAFIRRAIGEPLD